MKIAESYALTPFLLSLVSYLNTWGWNHLKGPQWHEMVADSWARRWDGECPQAHLPPCGHSSMVAVPKEDVRWMVSDLDVT